MRGLVGDSSMSSRVRPGTSAPRTALGSGSCTSDTPDLGRGSNMIWCDVCVLLLQGHQTCERVQPFLGQLAPTITHARSAGVPNTLPVTKDTHPMSPVSTFVTSMPSPGAICDSVNPHQHVLARHAAEGQQPDLERLVLISHSNESCLVRTQTSRLGVCISYIHAMAAFRHASVCSRNHGDIARPYGHHPAMRPLMHA